MHRPPVVLVGGTRAGGLHVCLTKRIRQFASIHSCLKVSPSSSLFLVLRRTGHGRSGKRNAQLTLPPPPKHCPVCMTAERPPSAALGRPAYVRVVCDPGVFSALHGVCVRWIVLRCGARFQYQYTQIYVRHREAARDDTSSSAACDAQILSIRRESGSVCVDGAPPAIMISYSSLIVVGVDIVSLFSQTLTG